MRVAGVVFASDLVGPPPTPLSLVGGTPMVAWAVSALRDGVRVERLVVVAAAAPDAGPLARALDDVLPGHGALVIAGARTRHGSLHRALSSVDSGIEIVVLHDADRPLAPSQVAQRVVEAVRRGGAAAAPVVEVTETVKELDATGRVASTVARESLVRLQSPQAVRRPVLEAAHARCAAADLLTDPVGALAPPGTALTLVEGDRDAFPIRHPADLSLADAVRASRHRPVRTRSGPAAGG